MHIVGQKKTREKGKNHNNIDIQVLVKFKISFQWLSIELYMQRWRYLTQIYFGFINRYYTITGSTKYNLIYEVGLQ